jgi:hypothetical protein
MECIKKFRSFLEEREHDMTQQTFPVGRKPRVVISQVEGNLTVRSWKEQMISVQTEGPVGELRQEGDTVMIIGCGSSIELLVPAIRNFGFFSITTDISVTNLSGHATIEDVGDVQLKEIGGNAMLRNIGGDVTLENIREVAELSGVGGDLRAMSVSKLLARKGIGGDASLSDVPYMELSAIGGDLSVARSESVVVNNIGGDVNVEGVGAVLHCGNVGGDCNVEGSARAEVSVGNIGGDLQVSSAARVEAKNIGGDCQVRDVQGDASVRVVGGDVTFMGVQGNRHVGLVGGSTRYR